MNERRTKPLKVVPFERGDDGVWSGKFGHLAVRIRQSTSGKYWRGPQGKPQVVVDNPRESYTVSIVGKFSSCAHTLAGAFAHGEFLAYEEQGRELPETPAYGMTAAEAANERRIHRESQLDAVEADRLAHENGWQTAISVLPTLKAFAIDEGLYPFEDPEPSSGMRP